MIGIKTALITSTVGLVGLGTITPLMDSADQLAHMSTAGVLGLVALASVSALVYVYKTQQKDHQVSNKRLHEIIKESVAVMAEVRDAIKDCHQKK